MTNNQDPLRIAREALEQAQQFIENGVESGYIRMPDQPESARCPLTMVL